MRRYTVAEANELLPHLAPTLVELRERHEESLQIRIEMTRAAATNGWTEKRDRWARTLARVDELVARLNEWEVELRDVSMGLVDFPSEVEGREAFLCWRLGEEEVAHWHSPDDGFAGRRRL
ncbi:MAG: DUF2203 domain-containing protein [Actinomycetota bacterium]|nr:DUF2203 domain-containing protein [Actinomycetota bacterium]